MKKNNIKNRLIVFISCLSLLFSLLSVNVFAAETPPFNDFLDGTGGKELEFSADDLNVNTVNAIFAYYDTLFNYNMTNGMRLVSVKFHAYGSIYYADLTFVSGSRYGANNNAASMAVNFYSVMNANTSSPTINLHVVDSSGTQSSVKYLKGRMTNEGSLINITYNSGNSITLTGSANVAYRDRYDVVNVWQGQYTRIAESGDVAPAVAADINLLNSFIGSFGSQTINSYDLDIGSIFTAMMTAGMSIFNGFFGFTLFGINIAGTLVAILVVAIVIFVVKWLLGGK